MASWNGSPSKTPLPLPVFDFLTTFIELKVVIAYAKQYASELNFITRHHPKSYFSEKAWPFSRPFPVDRYSMRGHILCSPKSNGRDVRSMCNWKLVYKYDKLRKVYMWLPEKSCLKHDHILPPIPITLDGCKDIQYEKDLTPKQYKFIKNNALMRIPVPMVKVNLEREFANHAFDYEMVRRVQNKTLDEIYGCDRTQLHALFVQGSEIRRLGGIFETIPSDDLSIESFHIQTARMRRYAIVYGVNDLKMVDATHHLTRYDRVTIVWNVVDCLQRTKLAGVSYSPSENHVPIIQGALHFFPGEDYKKGERNPCSCDELENHFNPQTGSETSLLSNHNPFESGSYSDGYEHPILNANKAFISEPEPPTKMPPMTMGASKDDPSITKFTIPISHVERSNHQSFGGILHLNNQTAQVTITKVVKGSLADQFCIKVGDELISINNCINCYGLDLFTKFASCTSNLFNRTNPQELSFQLKRQSSAHHENVATETVSDHTPFFLQPHAQ